jgi:uncharacterized protein YbaR (Trm112 family)/2-polyprenyl-3-methyl-5-hydroxy-6-metoxy-1,4-benzoquinol methylase
MKPRLLDLLVCPIDKSPLELIAWESLPVALSDADRQRIQGQGLAPSSFAQEILTGVLLNRARKIFYPIHKGIPRLLTFPTGLTQEFVQLHAARLAHELPGFTLPREPPPPGEGDVLRSFSREWVDYGWRPDAYWNLPAADLYRCMRFLLDLGCRPLAGQLVLEVGVGIGGIADYVASSEGCELVGVDLSYAVDAAYRHFGRNPLLHLVQASVFAPPFSQATFDFVYSQGVLMHTYSTKAAFDRLATLPRIGGRLYVWVYSHHDEQRSVKRRLLMQLEKALRPLLWRAPDRLQMVALALLAPLYLVHQNLHMRRLDKRQVKYGWREAMHAARDRFTPRYAHRHSEAEVCAWFREAGYTELRRLSQRRAPDFIPTSLLAAVGVNGVRSAS